MVPGVRVHWEFGGSRVSIPGAATQIGGGCEVKVFLDGLEFTWGSSTLDDIPTFDIEAIEVFRSLADLPPELAGSDARCGVVAVWTRRGRGDH
jgi:outer membrane cobalamin receptor